MLGGGTCGALTPCALPPLAAPLPASWHANMASLRLLSLGGNEWSAPLDGAWGDNATSAWPGSLEWLNLSDNPLPAGADIPGGWGGLGLHTLWVRAAWAPALMLDALGCSACRAEY